MGPYHDLAERLRNAAWGGAGVHLSADHVRAMLFGGAIDLIARLELDEISGKPTPYPLSEDAKAVADAPNAKPFTVATLAAHWGVSTTKIYDEIRGGRLQAFKLGGTLYRIKPEAVAAYEQGRRD